MNYAGMKKEYTKLTVPERELLRAMEQVLDKFIESLERAIGYSKEFKTKRKRAVVRDLTPMVDCISLIVDTVDYANRQLRAEELRAFGVRETLRNQRDFNWKPKSQTKRSA